MRQFCPNCKGELEYESIGMKCTRCKGFIDMHGNFHKYVERPFMPPKTNFSKITESVESLAELLCKAEYCPYIEDDDHGCDHSCLYGTKKCLIEWLQQEVTN